jgi:hypothetical protein
VWQHVQLLLCDWHREQLSLLPHYKGLKLNSGQRNLLRANLHRRGLCPVGQDRFEFMDVKHTFRDSYHRDFRHFLGSGLSLGDIDLRHTVSKLIQLLLDRVVLGFVLLS